MFNSKKKANAFVQSTGVWSFTKSYKMAKAILIYGLFASQVNAAGLANSQTFSAKSPTWKVNYAKAFDDHETNEARANSRGTASDVWLEFDFGAEHNNFDVGFLEDNQYPYAVSRWKVQGWQNNQWQDIDNWQAHNSTNYDPKFPIPSSYTTSKMRVLFQASVDNEVGLNELNITGSQVGSNAATPIAINEANFYTEPTSFNVTMNVVTDYGVNNTDTLNDTATLQAALDEISNVHGGGKLYFPAGDYYLRSLHLRSDVHLDIAQGATFHMVTAGNYNEWMFEMGNGNQGQAKNVSVVGRGNGFTIDLRDAPNERTAVFKMGDIENFKFANFTIEDNKTIFASFMVGITERNNDLHWPVNGVIKNISQNNSLFGYGLVQMYGADNILFRNIHSEGGITLRIETDNLTMKEYGKGGVRDIFAENVSGTDCLAPVMFGPHFQENGYVEVNGVTSNGCGQAVRVDSGFVELFSPAGQTYTRDQWKDEINQTYGEGCSAQPYARGVNQWAARINDVGNCIADVYDAVGLKPGSFESSNIFNVTANYGTNAHLKQNQLDYFSLTNPSCDNVCLPTTAQWAKRGQIYLGPSLSGVLDDTSKDGDYGFDINIIDLQMNGFPNPHHKTIDEETTKAQVCPYYGVPSCSNQRWD